MIWKVNELVHFVTANRMLSERGSWVPVRPLNTKYESVVERLRATWAVLSGRADAVIWPEVFKEISDQE